MKGRRSILIKPNLVNYNAAVLSIGIENGILRAICSHITAAKRRSGSRSHSRIPHRTSGCASIRHLFQRILMVECCSRAEHINKIISVFIGMVIYSFIYPIDNKTILRYIIFVFSKPFFLSVLNDKIFVVRKLCL